MMPVMNALLAFLHHLAAFGLVARGVGFFD
jgi:hypothetical protein